MKHLTPLLLFAIAVAAPTQQSASPSLPSLPADDAVRIQEFYRLAPAIEDRILPGWSRVPSPLLLVTADAEFLTHHPAPPTDWKKVSDDFYARPRQFPANLQATFPAFGPPAVIVIGQPAQTLSKTSTPWLFTVMHEHFHQLQDAQPGYFDAVGALGLSHGDTSGMWMLNYPFPYDKPEVAHAFADLRDLLVRALAEPDGAGFTKLARDYLAERTKFFAQLAPDDRKYFEFQLWQEGIARYTEVRSTEVAANFDPSPAFKALADYEPVAAFAAHKRADTLAELKQADLAAMKRVAVYSFGAGEGFLLDRINPRWKDDYFVHLFSLDSEFAKALQESR